MGKSEKYLERAIALINEIKTSENGKINIAGQKVADSIVNDGIIHLFGAGHSVLPTHEVYIRAGSLTCSRPISLERYVSLFETLEGSGDLLMSGFDGKESEVLIVFSNSGVNPLPLEVAFQAKKMELYVIAVTSFEHTNKVDSKHSSGKKLIEIADLAIDSHAPYGDAALDLDSLPMKIGPVSTIANVVIINSIMCSAIEKLVAIGETPPVRISRNMPGGREHNEKLVSKYVGRIPELDSGL